MSFESGSEKESRKRSKRCCLIVCAIIFIVIARDPKVSVSSDGLANFDIFSDAATTPLPMTITITNPNYGTFYYQSAHGYLHYRGVQVADAPIEPGKVAARKTVNVNAMAAVQTKKITTHENFFDDVGERGLSFTATASLPGKVVVINIIKVKAKVDIFCDVFLNITSVPMALASNCKTKITV
ncbi:hypothetical protein PIB30_001664 [Stylosanthes scabra]|uniref:Late embryogenesis abundant protein LEA-2 subgroup domain-containing protein n=1 Tax=Stylosanthes scabra TaxID=79078 RepID=A0ABU6T2F6_9FABA|nr:hypothetical protein [Stylosanthes scabra]